MEGWDGGTNRAMFTLHTWLLYGEVRGFNMPLSDERAEGQSGSTSFST